MLSEYLSECMLLLAVGFVFRIIVKVKVTDLGWSLHSSCTPSLIVILFAHLHLKVTYYESTKVAGKLKG